MSEPTLVGVPRDRVGPSRPAPEGATHADARQPWWRNAVIYEVYLRSFADGDGDGTGDLAGVRSRLRVVSQFE